MKNRYLKIVWQLILIILLFAFQFSFIWGQFNFLNTINVVLLAIIFVLGFQNLKQALLWAFFSGLLFDLYSFYPFGMNILVLVLLTLLANFLLNNFFTNRSLYSFLGLTFFSTIIYNLIFHFFAYIINFFKYRADLFLLKGSFWQMLGLQVFLHLVLVFLIFHIINFFDFKFHPVSFSKKKKLK